MSLVLNNWALISFRKYTLLAQLLQQLSADHFETMHSCSTWFEDVHVALGLFFHYFFFNCFHFLDVHVFFFRCDMMMWVQLLLVLYQIFLNFQVCLSWSRGVHVTKI